MQSPHISKHLLLLSPKQNKKHWKLWPQNVLVSSTFRCFCVVDNKNPVFLCNFRQNQLNFTLHHYEDWHKNVSRKWQWIAAVSSVVREILMLEGAFEMTGMPRKWDALWRKVMTASEGPLCLSQPTHYTLTILKQVMLPMATDGPKFSQHSRN